MISAGRTASSTDIAFINVILGYCFLALAIKVFRISLKIVNKHCSDGTDGRNRSQMRQCLLTSSN